MKTYKFVIDSPAYGPGPYEVDQMPHSFSKVEIETSLNFEGAISHIKESLANLFLVKEKYIFTEEEYNTAKHIVDNVWSDLDYGVLGV